MGWLRRLTAPSRERFTRLAANALRRYGAPEPIEVEAADFALKVGPGDRRFFLGNAYADYCSAGLRDRPKVLEGYFNYALLSAEMPADYASAKPDLLPKVRERFFRETLRLMAEAGGDVPKDAPCLPLTDEYVLELVWDQPMTMAVVSQETLDRWGVSFAQALADARDNLWNLSKGKFETVQPGLHVSAWHDTHDASRAFLHDLVWHLDVTGDHVVFLPNRNWLVVTGADDVAGLTAAASMTEQLLDEPRAMSGVPLRLRDKTWEIFAPGDEHGAALPLRNLRLLSAARHYAEQKELLEKADRARGRDVFHASCKLMQRKDGSRFTYAVWAGAIPSTLPIVEQVMFVREGADGQPESLGAVPWARVVDVMGPVMRPFAAWPPRHAVATFPTPDQLARLAPAPL